MTRGKERRKREKPVRDRGSIRCGPSSLIGILLFATDASFHNKSPNSLPAFTVRVFFFFQIAQAYVCHMQRLSLPVSHPQPAYQNQYLMQMEERGEERRGGLHVPAGKALICVCVEAGNVSFSLTVCLQLILPKTTSILEFERSSRRLIVSANTFCWRKNKKI